jgi:hypothetical protein
MTLVVRAVFWVIAYLAVVLSPLVVARTGRSSPTWSGRRCRKRTGKTRSCSLSNQILELTKAIHSSTTPRSGSTG